MCVCISIRRVAIGQRKSIESFEGIYVRLFIFLIIIIIKIFLISDIFKTTCLTKSLREHYRIFSKVRVET